MSAPSSSQKLGESSSPRQRTVQAQSDDEEFLGLDDLLPAESPVPAPFSFSTYEIPEDVHIDLDEARGRQLILRLVGNHPLWGHHLWNTARCLSTYLLRTPDLTKGRRVLELGAGAGLPSIVCALAESHYTLVTDYPDNSLIGNMEYNVDINVEGERRERIGVAGHVWGHNVQPLLDHLPGSEQYDLLILSDLVFNHSQHDALIKTVEATLTHDETRDPCILVFFSHHRPHLAHADMAFFPRLAESGSGWAYEEIVAEWTGPMFEEDPGDARVRGTVHGWRAWRIRAGEEKGERPSRVL
ncbi:hypothetical protein IAR55_003467 [Kwoniella newhampshirensis]|uniref:Elongation factor methyltransferase 7 n=1 Tax=Kwoniella newhampshirensis TaxID=1651941 RepID=A0AAW0YWZ5_9TREE